MQMDASGALKCKLDALRPLNQDRIQLLWPQWRAEDALFVYATNAVEGSTLTLGETLAVLEHGVTVSGKPMADHLDAVNGQKAYSAMLDLAQERAKIGPETVLDLHRTIVGDVSYGGQLRRLVGEMLARYDEGMSNGEHPVRVASTLHFDLLTIHPFKDGNGRTARLLENLHLIREGFVPILIGPEEKPRYFEVLERSQVAVPGVGDPTEFIAYMADLEKEALQRYLAALHTAHGESADDSIREQH
ncbi:MAG TPA: Fic family protein [Candidatus Elarobacter sp.]|jgi:Fic family protein